MDAKDQVLTSMEERVLHMMPMILMVAKGQVLMLTEERDQILIPMMPLEERGLDLMPMIHHGQRRELLRKKCNISLYAFVFKLLFRPPKPGGPTWL